MQSVKRFQSRLFACVVIIAIGVSACKVGTVTPSVVSPSGASYDGGVRNSGIVGTNDAGQFIVTDYARTRYTNLLATYKADIIADPQRGTTRIMDGYWLFDKEAMVRFMTVSRWHRNGKPEK